LDEEEAAFSEGSLDAGPRPYPRLDAPVVPVRAGMPAVRCSCVVATAVVDGAYREIHGLDLFTVDSLNDWGMGGASS
jgi:transposase-like protein